MDKHIDFESLLKDEAFTQRIKRDQEELTDYPDVLIKEHPDLKDEILYAVDFVHIYHSSKKKLSEAEIGKMWENIRKNSKVKKLHEDKHSDFFLYWKVAASVAILLSFSYILFFRQNPASNKNSPKTEVISDGKATIILSDGSQYQLDNNNVSIKYSTEGSEVIIEGTGNTKKLENRSQDDEPVLNQVIVPHGHRHRITLCDGTSVHLNSGSRLIFPAMFSNKNREVYLTGEGFFEVMRDVKRPFVVNSNYFSIKVLGTRFNVAAYDDEKEESAVLVEGSIEVSLRGKISGIPGFTIKAGEGCFYSVGSAEPEVRRVNILDYISWKDGWFQFKDQPLYTVIGRVEKYYDRSITVENPELANTLISGKLVLSDNFDEVITYLSKTLEARYFQNEKGYFLIQ